MNRKNTILLAVFINAALLIVLFATALTTQEEIALAPTHEISKIPGSSQDGAPPMFADELDFILRAGPTVASEARSGAQLSDEALVTKSEPPTIVHSLPPIQPNAAALETGASPLPLLSRPLETSSPSTGLQEAHVKKGDTLEKIARAHHTTVDEIIKLNHLPSSFLRVGQVLKLPAEKTSSAKMAKSAAPEKLKQDTGPDYYTVKVGDNPWMIAIKHHLKLEELLKLNGLNEEKARKLKPGDRLRIK